MPEMSFGRTIKFRRTKLGLSQARLGELVGRSAAAVRTWEKDSVTPADVGVVQALAAVLGIEQTVLFDKAGLEPPAIEESPTMEQILGSLAPEGDYESSVTDEVDNATDDPVHGEPDPDEPDPGEPEEQFTLGDFEPEDRSEGSGQRQAVGLVTTSPSITYTIPAPPVPEPTYVEDESQRQMYRLRHLATLVAVVALVVMFLWAMGRGWSEFGAWWDDFVGTLQL